MTRSAQTFLFGLLCLAGALVLYLAGLSLLAAAGVPLP